VVGETTMTTTSNLNRRDVVKQLLADRQNLLVVTGLGSPTYDVYSVGEHSGNFYLWGAMGGAGMVGLGLALAQPDKPVAVFTGDGEQLMGVGGLLTIAAKKPDNLTVVVLDNGHFGETGMQASHTGLGADLAGIASSAGFKQVKIVRSMDELNDCRALLHANTGGPAFILVKIAAENFERALAPRDGAYVKNRFRENLGFHTS
jgi:thiamine pyrophosphate-dependent acetolactate synthase large subunit-like protein